MQITQQKIDELNAVLKLEVKKEDYEPKVMTALKSHRKQADMKGFRKGQVPMSIIKKMYGNRVLLDTVNETLNQEINSYIVDNKLDVLGHPMPKEGQNFDIEINDIKDFNFEYEIGLAPAFETTYLDSKPKIEREVAKIDKKIIDEEMDNMRKRYGKVEEVEAIKKDDMLNVRIQELDENGAVVETGTNNTTSITLDMLKDDKKMKKMKKGETIDLDVFEAFEKDEAAIAKHILGAEDRDFGEKKPTFKITLETIKRVMPAEINTEFLDNVFGKDAVKDEAGMREKIEADLAAHFDRQADAKVYTKIADELIENTKMELPDDFLKRWIKLTNENPISDEDLEKDYPAFRKNLKWSLIIKKVGSENNIEVSEEEVKAKTAVQISAQMAQYGMSNMPEAEMENFVASMMARKDHVDQTKQAILEEKIYDYFKTKVEMKDKKVAMEDFNKQ
ncbi:MAG: trigger factor [Chitinophagales bacterium]